MAMPKGKITIATKYKKCIEAIYSGRSIYEVVKNDAEAYEIFDIIDSNPKKEQEYLKAFQFCLKILDDQDATLGNKFADTENERDYEELSQNMMTTTELTKSLGQSSYHLKMKLDKALKNLFSKEKKK